MTVSWILPFSFAISAFAQQMTLDVVVTDKSGKPVGGLTQQDFTLLDNKQPQKLLSFQAVQGNADDPPVQVILLLDEVNTGFNSVAYERDQIERFLKRDGGQLARPMSFAFLTDAGLSFGNAVTRDGNALLADLNQNKSGLRTITRAQGFYGANDRLEICLRALQQLADYETPRPGRKLVLWISPGWPLLSGPEIELTQKSQQNFFANIVGLSAALRGARITLDSIDPLGTSDAGGTRTIYYQAFLKGVKKPSQVQIGNLGLQVLAYQSGGRVLNSSNDVAGEIATCVNDTSSYYIVTINGLRGDGPNEYHALHMKLDKPGLTARTRAGYYAQP